MIGTSDGADAADDVETVDVGQAEVENHHVGLSRLAASASSPFPASRIRYRCAARLVREPPDRRLVVDDQDERASAVIAAASSPTRVPAGAGKVDGERRAGPVGCGCRPDGAAECLDEAAADGQSQAGPGPLAVALAPVELVENALQLGCRNARALVRTSSVTASSCRPTIAIVEPAGAYFAALSSRLTNTCSNSTGSSTSIGKSAASRLDAVLVEMRAPLQRGADRLADVDHLPVQLEGAQLQPCHVEQVADEAIEPLALPPDVRRQLVRVAGVVESRRCRDVAAPRIEASGVLRSWEIEVSSAERSRSVSARTAPRRSLPRSGSARWRPPPDPAGHRAGGARPA